MSTISPLQAYTIRRVASAEELELVFDVLGAQLAPPLTHGDRTSDDLRTTFREDRPLMLVAEKGGHIVGGALGFGETLRIIAVVPQERGKGLGRRLIQLFEVSAMQHGVRMISLGAVQGAKGFYERLGYRGKSSTHKELPLPGPGLELRLRRLETALGDWEAGQVVELGADGKVPSLF